MYSHLEIHEPRHRLRPPTPEVIITWRNQRNKEMLQAQAEAEGTNVQIEDDVEGNQHIGND